MRADSVPTWFLATRTPYLGQQASEELWASAAPPASPDAPLMSAAQIRGQRLPERLMAQFPAAAPGQATVTFTPQGSLPWLPRNVAIDYLIICAPAGTSVPAGEIYQVAAKNGIPPQSPGAAKSLLYRQRAMNGWEIFFDVMAGASLAIPILGQSGGVIAMNAKKQVIFLAAHGALDYARPQVERRLPDPTPTIDLLLDPNATLIFSGACVEATMAVRASKRPRDGTYTIQ